MKLTRSASGSWHLTCICAIVLAFSCVGNARADGGGASIATAPELPLGTPVQGGTDATSSGGEFWRVQLAAGDRLYVEYLSTTTERIYLDVYASIVTDATLAGASPAASGETGSKGEAQLTWIAPSSGQWIVELSCDCVNGVGLAYELTAQVQQFTRVTLHAPAAVATGRPATIRGAVSGVAAGRIELGLTSPGRRPVSAEVPLADNGSFVWTTALPHPGSWRLRAVYRGGVDHLPSSATAVIRVS